MKNFLTPVFFCFALLMGGCSKSNDTSENGQGIQWPAEYSTIILGLNTPGAIEIEFTTGSDWTIEIVETDGTKGGTRATWDPPFEVYPTSGQAGKNLIRLNMRVFFVPLGNSANYMMQVIAASGGTINGSGMVKVPVTVVPRKRIANISLTGKDIDGNPTVESTDFIYDDTKGGILTHLDNGSYKTFFTYTAAEMKISTSIISGVEKSTTTHNALHSFGRLRENTAKSVYSDPHGSSTNTNEYEYVYDLMSGCLKTAQMKNKWSIVFTDEPEYNNQGGYNATLNFTWSGGNLHKIETTSSALSYDYPETYEYSTTKKYFNNLNIDLWVMLNPFNEFEWLPQFVGFMGGRSAYLPIKITTPNSETEFAYYWEDILEEYIESIQARHRDREDSEWGEWDTSVYTITYEE